MNIYDCLPQFTKLIIYDIIAGREAFEFDNNKNHLNDKILTFLNQEILTWQKEIIKTKSIR